MTNIRKFNYAKTSIDKYFKYNAVNHYDEKSVWSNDCYEITLLAGCETLPPYIYIKRISDAEFDERIIGFEIPDDNIWSSLRMVKILY